MPGYQRNPRAATPGFADDPDRACRNTDPDLFYPGPGQPGTEAKAVCRPCPVRNACREYAIAHREFGVWGGTNEHQRTHIRRERETQGVPAAPAGPAPWTLYRAGYVAARLGISPGTVYQAVRDRHLRPANVRVKGRWSVFTEADIEAYAAWRRRRGLPTRAAA